MHTGSTAYSDRWVIGVWTNRRGLAADQGSGLMRRLGSLAQCFRLATGSDLRRWHAAPRPDQTSWDARTDRRSHRPASRPASREVDSVGTAPQLRCPTDRAPWVRWFLRVDAGAGSSAAAPQHDADYEDCRCRDQCRDRHTWFDRAGAVGDDVARSELRGMGLLDDEVLCLVCLFGDAV